VCAAPVFNQAVDVVFVLFDDHAAAAPDGTIVDFTLFGPNGGETISPSSVASSRASYLRRS